MAYLDKLFSRLSKGSDVDIVNEVILGNVIGFYQVDSTVQTGQFILEIARFLSNSGRKVCIIDTNPLSDFYSSKFSKKLSKMVPDEVPSIAKRLTSSGVPLKDCLLDASDNLKVLNFGNTAYSNVFDMDFGIIESLFLEVKDNFDVVLVDICNMPILESVVVSLKLCNKVYSMWGMNIDSYTQHTKIKNFFDVTDVGYKLDNIILNNIPYGSTLIGSYRALKDTNLNFEIELPEITASRLISENLYILDKLDGKSAVQYAAGVDYVIKNIIKGTGGEIVDKG